MVQLALGSCVTVLFTMNLTKGVSSHPTGARQYPVQVWKKIPVHTLIWRPYSHMMSRSDSDAVFPLSLAYGGWVHDSVSQIILIFFSVTRVIKGEFKLEYFFHPGLRCVI